MPPESPNIFDIVEEESVFEVCAIELVPSTIKHNDEAPYSRRFIKWLPFDSRLGSRERLV